MVYKLMTAVALCVVAASITRPLLACGASAGGTPGVSSCSVDEHEEAIRKKMHVGIAGSYTTTEMKFSGDRRVDQTRYVALASFELRPTSASSYQLGAGPFLGGHMKLDDVTYDFATGFVAAASGSWRVVDAVRARPFVLLGAQLAAVSTRTRPNSGTEGEQGYQAYDLRLSAAVGWTLARLVSPYVVARAFGGPAYWRVQGEDVQGTDAYHYQLGAGASVLIARRLDVFVEGVGLGERGVSTGMGVAF